MLDLNFIRQNQQRVKDSAKNKNVKIDLDYFLKLDQKRRSLIKEIDDLRSGHHIASESLRVLPDLEKKAKAEELKKQKNNILGKEKELNSVENEFKELWNKIPNVYLDEVPVGKDENENVVVKTWGEPKKFDFKPLDHLALGERLGIIDMERAAKVSGSRFYYLKKGAAVLEFALMQFAISILTSESMISEIAGNLDVEVSTKPFMPIIPPTMIRPDVYKKMARLSEDDKDEKYYIPQDDLYLIGSAEHTLGAMYLDEFISESDLPLRYLGFSTSFRREAGSYGKDTRGILRVHQFDKLEMESFSKAEDSLKEQEFLVAVQEHMMQKLAIPYQVVLLCTGDMGKPDLRQIDIECWMPGQGRYRETHSADLMGDFQSRRLNTRYKNKNGSNEFVHMNDATLFAMSRMIIAIMENYQQKDGSIIIPEALQPFSFGLDVIG